MGLLEKKEAADMLGIPEATLDFWRAMKRGPDYIKLGRHIKYRQEDLEAFVQRQRVSAGVHSHGEAVACG